VRENIDVVRKPLRHKTAVLTLDRYGYGHLCPDDLDAVPTAFDSAADRPRTNPALNAVVASANSL
jgi:hypothetical protein